MKKLLFTSLLSLGLVLPANIFASANSTASTTELFFSQEKGKKKKSKKGKTRRSTASRSKGCTYNGHSLNVGPRGGCYYYSGSSKKYVDRSYCSGCN